MDTGLDSSQVDNRYFIQGLRKSTILSYISESVRATHTCLFRLINAENRALRATVHLNVIAYW